MAKIKMVAHTLAFESLSNETCSNNEHNDCAVKAVALVANVSYKDAHAALAALGRKARKATQNVDIQAAIWSLGKTTTSIDRRAIIATYPEPHRSVLRNVTTHHPRRFAKVWPQGTYLLYTSGHVAACVDGVVHDWTVNTAKRVVSIVKVG